MTIFSSEPLYTQGRGIVLLKCVFKKAIKKFGTRNCRCTTRVLTI